MRKFDAFKSQYVDISFGWRERGDNVRLHERKRRRRRILLYGFVGIPALCYLCWHFMFGR